MWLKLSSDSGLWKDDAQVGFLDSHEDESR